MKDALFFPRKDRKEKYHAKTAENEKYISHRFTGYTKPSGLSLYELCEKTLRFCVKGIFFHAKSKGLLGRPPRKYNAETAKRSFQ
jgi:hypothetical protein